MIAHIYIIKRYYVFSYFLKKFAASVTAILFFFAVQQVDF